MSGPAIAILPYEHRQGRGLSKTPLAALNWPLGCPDRLVGGRIEDMAASDHLILYPRTRTHFDPRKGVAAQVSLIMGEPAAIHRKHIALLRVSHRRFFRILTFHQSLLDRLGNAVLLPYGTTWVPDWRDLEVTKTRMTSLIASAKRDSDGHRLRHAVADWVAEEGRDVDVIGGGYRPFERKSDGLAPYRYSVVIENTREANYFSEKLVDAVLCATVPIYWGCPNLDRFFDTAGIIRCESEADIRRAIETASEADYQSRLPHLMALQSEVARYTDLETRAAETIREAL